MGHVAIKMGHAAIKNVVTSYSRPCGDRLKFLLRIVSDRLMND